MYKLLIVDDEPIIRKGIIKLVDMSELLIDEVFEAENGEMALEIVKDRSPDIVLTDINMPPPDGLELAKSIKKINKKTRVVLITGYDYFDYALSAIKAGVDDYLLKPVSKNDIKELLMRLKNILDEERQKEKADKLFSESIYLNNTDKNKYMANDDYKSQIIDIINSQFSQSEFTLAQLADEIKLNKSYLSTIFKQSFGITFQDYLINLRLEKSKILLLSTGMKIYEIAQKVGFEDANYFSSSFKKKYGVTPNGYRENV